MPDATGCHEQSAGVRSAGAGRRAWASEMPVLISLMEEGGHMDRSLIAAEAGQEAKRRFDWLPTAMPGVARLMRERRARLGDAHVNECWRRGVVEREPGWFFAREGALAVGTPWPDIADVAGWQVSETQALLIMREARHGAD